MSDVEAAAGQASAPAGPGAFGFGRLFEAVRDAIVVADADGRIALWNPAAAAMFGFEAGEAVGAPVEIIVPPELREAHRRGIARFRDTGHGRYLDGDAILELPALRKDGTRIHVEMTLSRVRGPGGLYVLSILRDVTARRRAEDEVVREREGLRAANAALARANDALEAFSYVVSHDLKEPVRALEGLLLALEEDHARALPPEGAALVARSRASARRLRALVEDLLEYSRATREEARVEPVDVQAVLSRDECRSLYETLLHERGARLEVAPGIPRVMASPPAICRILGNLVSNAIRHNPRADPRVRVSGRPAPGGLVELLVEDNGPGLPPEARARFQQGRLQARGGGGFGLAIVRRAVEHLGGAVRAGPSEMGGTAVSVLLPPAGD